MGEHKSVPGPIPSSRPHKPSGRSGMAHSPTAHPQPKSIPTGQPKSNDRSDKVTTPHQLRLGPTRFHIQENHATCRIRRDLRIPPHREKRSVQMPNDRVFHHVNVPTRRIRQAMALRECHWSSMYHC